MTPKVSRRLQPIEFLVKKIILYIQREVFKMPTVFQYKDAINHMVHDEVSTKCPATILRTHACAMLYVDQAAGAFVIE